MRSRAAVLAAAMALGVLGAPSPAWALPPDTWLVAFASNRGDAGELPLLYAERDAQQLAEVLQAHGGVSPRRTIVLGAARVEEVRDTLHEVNARIREAGGGRPTALVVFYSGHADAEALHLGGTRLRVEELESVVRGSAATVRLLVIDACRSGAITRVKGVQPAPEFEMKLQGEVTAEGLAIVTSSAAGESSQESDQLRGSFFTHHLVNALRGAGDQDQDHRVTLAEVYAYTYAQTLRSSGRTAALQHPTYSYDVKGKGELVMSQPSAAQGRGGWLRLAEPTTYVITEGREGGPVAAEVAPPRAATLLALPEGAYFVQERLPSEYREYEVRVASGREVALASLPHRAVRYDQLVRRRGGEKAHLHGLMLLAGGRGAALEGETVPFNLLAGYTLDLPWLSVSARLRAATASSRGLEELLPGRHEELGAGVLVQPFAVDFPIASVGLGLMAEAVLHRQTFAGVRDAPDRLSLGASFGGLLSVERHLYRGVALRVEASPLTLFFRKAAPPEQGGSVLATPFTWWAAGGLVWRL